MSEIEHLRPQEKLILYRRRRGLTQAQMAKENKLSLKAYQKRETGKTPPSLSPPNIEINDLTDAERCFLYRKRCSITQAEIAKDLNLSRYYVNQMELNKVSCDTLLWYWEQ